MGRSPGSVRLAASLLAAAVATSSLPVAAGIPEPDAIFYGKIRMEGYSSTTPTVFELVETASQRTLTPISESHPEGEYTFEWVPDGSDPYYLVRVRLDSSTGSGGCLTCATLGDRLEVYVGIDPDVHQAGNFAIGTRGRVTRQDLVVYQDGLSNPRYDADQDGVPDFMDNCIAIGVGASQVDTDGDGIGDGCEGFEGLPLSETYTSVDGSTPNAPDLETDKGGVDGTFHMTHREVTNADWVSFLNRVAIESDPHGLYNPAMMSDPRGGVLRDGAEGAYTYEVKPRMADKPVNFVSWLDAARYVNWIENDGATMPFVPESLEVGAYDLGGLDPAFDAMLTETARFALPSQDEWYKAAYYEPSSDEYRRYPVQSFDGIGNLMLDQQPNVIGPVNGVGTMERPPGYDARTCPDDGPADCLDVVNILQEAKWDGLEGHVVTTGSTLSPSYYGIYEMGGNVSEWLGDDSQISATDGRFERKVRGGSFASSDMAPLDKAHGMEDPDRLLKNPLVEDAETGFRVVDRLRDAPEPGRGLMLASGLGLLVLMRARRGRSGKSL